MKHSVDVWQFPDLLVERYRCAPGPSEHVASHAHDEYQFGLSMQVASAYSYRGIQHSVPQGALCVLHPGEVHSTWDAEPRPLGTAYHMLSIQPSVLRQVTADIVGRSMDEPFFPTPVLIDHELLELFHQLWKALEGTTDQLEQDCLRLEALSYLVMHYAQPIPSPHFFSSSPPALMRAREFLHDHPARNVSLEELAQIAGVSVYHLCRLFRRGMGLSPYQYHLQVRIARAKSQLLQGIPLADVAREAGFYDQSRFGRYFKRVVGVTPGNYGKSKNYLDPDVRI